MKKYDGYEITDDPNWFLYYVDEVDPVMAAKDARIAELEGENRKIRHVLADAVFREMNGEKPVIVLDKHGITIA